MGTGHSRISKYQLMPLFLLYLGAFRGSLALPEKSGEGLAKIVVSGGNKWPHMP
jgi:hypothetical protein